MNKLYFFQIAETLFSVSFAQRRKLLKSIQVGIKAAPAGRNVYRKQSQLLSSPSRAKCVQESYINAKRSVQSNLS